MKSKKLLAVSFTALALMLAACNGAGGASSSSAAPSSNKPSTSEVDPTSVHPTGVALNRNEFEGEVGDQVKLYANVSPSDAYNRNVVWSTSNNRVATVADGLVTIVGKGTAIITAKTVDGGFEDTCVVKCEDELPQVICYASDLVDTYCWNMEESNVDYDAYLGQSSAGHLFFEYAPGDLVYFVADYDDDEVVLDGYKYYVDGALYGYAGILDYAFYIQVPEECSQVILLPVAHKAAAPDTNEYFRIYNGSEHARVASVAGTKVNNGALYGAAGQKVEFSVNVEAGYDFADVEVVTATANVDVILNAAGNYEFVMPGEAVQINIAAVAHNFAFNRVDEKSLINTIYVGEEVLKTNVNYAPCGETITILFNTSNKDYVAYGVALFNNEGEYIGTVPAVQNGAGVAFKMPCFGITAEVIWEARSYAVNLFDTDNIQLVPYVKVDGEYVVADPEDLRVAYNGSIYFKVVTSDPDLTPKAVAVDDFKYVNYIGSTYEYTQYSKSLAVNADGYYEFALSVLATSAINIRVTGELDVTAYADADIAGNYLGMYSWGTDKSDIQPAAGYNSVIETTGSWKEGSTQYYITSFNAYSHKGTYENPSYADRSYQFYYRNGFMFTAKDTSTLFGTYKYTYVKMQDGDTADNYSVHAETFASGNYLAVQVLREGEAYANLFVDKAAEKIYTNVSFEFVNGEYVNDLTAVYNVKVGNNTLYAVGYNGGTGGAANRALANPANPRGTFISAKGDVLEFDGFNHVKYDGRNWAVEIDADGNAKGAPIGGGKDSLTFKIYPTLGLVENVEVVAYQYKNQLEGRIFKGLCHKYWYSSGTHTNDKIVNIEINFIDDTHVTVQVISNGTIVLGNVTTQSKLDENYYTISGNKVEVYFNDKNASYVLKNWNFTLSDDWMTLTCTSTNRLADSNYDYVLPDVEPLQGSALNTYKA